MNGDQGPVKKPSTCLYVLWVLLFMVFTAVLATMQSASGLVFGPAHANVLPDAPSGDFQIQALNITVNPVTTETTPPITPSVEPTGTISVTSTPTLTGTATGTPTPTQTVTATSSPTPTGTATATSSPTPTGTATATSSPTPTGTATATSSPTPTETPTTVPTLSQVYLPVVAIAPPWTSQGLDGQRIRDLALVGDDIYAASQTNGAYQAVSACDPQWAPIGPAGTFALSVLVDGNVTLVGTFNNKLYRRVGTDAWIQIDVGNPNIWALAKGADDTLYAGTDAGVYRSDEQGRIWQGWSQGLPEDSQYINDLLVDSEGNVWAATFGGGVYARESNGDSWILASSGLATPNALRAWSLTQDSDENIFVGTADGVFRWNRFGWIRFGLDGEIVYALAASDDALYAGTRSGGVYMHTGASWHPMGDGWPANTIVDDLLIYTSDSCNAIFAATDRGIWRHLLPRQDD